MSSIKSMIGHTMGAASALETIACCLAIETGSIPPTIHYQTPDPECGIDAVPNEARQHHVDAALNNAFAFGGNNSCLVLTAPPK
jgi:3-oxoacyl-[acyl-carrier-protein] synthase II